MNIEFITKSTINIPKLSWNRRYVNSIGNEFMSFHLQNGYFKQTRSLSPKSVVGNPKVLRLRTQLLNDRRFIQKVGSHIFKEFR